MQSTDALVATQNGQSGHEPSPHKRSVAGSLGYLAILALGVLAVASPLAAAGLLFGSIALAILLWQLVRNVARHSGSVRHATIPGSRNRGVPIHPELTTLFSGRSVIPCYHGAF